MTDVPSNLIPTRITQLPLAPVADENSLMMIVYQGQNYQIRVGDLLSVAGVPTTRQVIAGTGMTGGGQLSSNVTLSIAPGGVGSTQLANSGVTPGVYGSATNIPVFTVDATGRVMAATTVPATISGFVPDSRQVIAGTGLSGGGALTSNVTLTANLSNATPLAGFQSGSAGSSTDMSRADHRHPAINLSADDEVDGLLGLGNGGTGRSISATPGAIVWCGADGLYVSAVGAPGQVLVSNGTNAPSWGSALIISDQPANVVYAGPSTGPAAPTAFRSLVIDDLPASGVTAASYGTASSVPTINVNSKGQVTSASNTSIAIDASQVSTGTLPVARGGTGLATTPANGAIDIGNGTGFTRTTITPSSGISVTNGAGSITIANSGVLSLSGGTTGLTPSSATTGAVTLGGTLSVPNGGTGVTTLTGYAKGNGTTAFTGITAIPNADLQNSSLTIGSTPISLGGTAATISGLTTLTLTQNPLNPLDAATKQYVDAAVEGLNVHEPVAAATTANLTATYNNGVSGVGATLTNAGAQAAFAVDGYTALLNDRILVKNQSNAAQNGVYTVTTLGSGSTNWVLTRSTDMDVAGSGANNLGPGDYFFVIKGTLGAGTSWVVTTELPITIGTTPVTFVQFAGPGTYTAGAGLTLTGTQFSITSTGVSAATYGTASSVPTIAVDVRGQITSASNTAIAIDATQVTSGTLNSARLSGSYTGITGVGTLSAGTWQGSVIAAIYGGTGLSSFTQGDLLYASSSTTLAALPDVATGNALISGGVSADPSWGKIGLTTHVSGTLPIANGGTNSTSTPTAGGAAYGTGSAFDFTAAGVSGQVLRSNGAGAPTWSGIDGGTF